MSRARSAARLGGGGGNKGPRPIAFVFVGLEAPRATAPLILVGVVVVEAGDQLVVVVGVQKNRWSSRVPLVLD